MFILSGFDYEVLEVSFFTLFLRISAGVFLLTAQVYLLRFLLYAALLGPRRAVEQSLLYRFIDAFFLQRGE